ncbi:hypothetical protein QYM36_003359 [Artemia franciscana]|uniref:Uncharacterized protein n=1 Tax=Artemia franciscana TaxID=6661 RepID=A0AA88L8J3_ARTSF|nr:hypothetical protein QYM36_003359 [Artemia franciscana]
MAPPSASEILNATERLKNNKSAGEDGLLPEVYKASPRVVAQQLETLFSLIWEKKTFPSDWKMSVITPVFKKGDKYDSRNYRRISLMYLATKVFAMIMLNRFEEDDIDALAADLATAQAMLNEIAHFSQLLGMKINTAKTKVMDLNIQSDYQLVLYGQELEKVDGFTYLGSVIDPHRGCDVDVQNRINKAQAFFSQLRRHL